MGHPSPSLISDSYGVDGEYFVGETEGWSLPNEPYDNSIIDSNQPPRTQPCLWCQWIVSEDGSFIEWDGGEKFYHSVEWMQYIINNFISPTGSICDGIINAYGDDREDVWDLVVENNTAMMSDPVASSKQTIKDLTLRVNNYERITSSVTNLVDAYIELLLPVAENNSQISASKALEFAQAIKNKLT